MTSGCQIGILSIATVNPAIAAKTTGMRHSVSSACFRIEQAGAEGEMQGVFDHEQDHRRRQGASPQASTASGRPMLPELLNSIGGTSVFGWTADQPGKRPGEQAAGRQHEKTAQRQRPVGQQIEGFAGHRGEDQRRHENIHVQPVGHRHFRLVVTSVKIARRTIPKIGKRMASRRKLRLSSGHST
jgi:hypothetical protein